MMHQEKEEVQEHTQAVSKAKFDQSNANQAQWANAMGNINVGLWPMKGGACRTHPELQ